MHSSQDEGVQPPRRQPPECPSPARFGAWTAFIIATVGITLIALGFAHSPKEMPPLLLVVMLFAAAMDVGTMITAIAALNGSLVGYYVLMVLAAFNVVLPLWMPAEPLTRPMALTSFVLLVVAHPAYRVFAHNKKAFSLPAENAPAPPASSAT